MKNYAPKYMLSLLAVLFIIPLSYAQRNKKDTEQNGESDYYLSDVSLDAFKFRSIGPALTSGRIADFAVNPDNQSEFFVAVAAGGVWKTTNRGVTFTPVFD